MTAPETTPAIERAAPTPDFLPGSRLPVTPRERASDAVWRYENYDGASCVTSRDADGVAAAALTAALPVEEVARVLGESAKRHGDDPDDETGRWTYTFDSRELHCRCGALIARAGDNLLPTQAWTHHLHESQAEALRAALVGEA